MKCQLAAALLGLLTITAHAAAAPTERQCATTGLFVMFTTDAVELAALKISTGTYSTNDQLDALAELDRKKLSAIKGVSAAPAYQAALKEFVVVARDYLRNIGAEPGESRIVYQARTAALKSRLEQAQERVTLEGELACGG